MLLDDWTEEIPTASETTGISFRFNQPNAAPPQTLLLAVTPEETGSWDWDDLVGILERHSAARKTAGGGTGATRKRSHSCGSGRIEHGMRLHRRSYPSSARLNS